MSQTIVPPAPAGGRPQSAAQTGSSGPTGPGGPAPAVGTLGHRIASASATIRHYLDGSPGRLRMVSAVAVLAAVAAALGGGAALRERSGALDEAKRSAAHLVLVQSVQIRLAQADADATNSFLKFGLEPQNQRLEYVAAIQSASRDLALAAQGSPEDAAALGQANAALTRYTGYIGSARANNRLGRPVGANYLTTASALLSSDVVPQLEARAKADQEKIDSAYSRAGNAAWWLALVAVVGLGVLIWAQIYLARHSRRILNIPLAAATVGLLVALIVAAGVMIVGQSRANEVREGDLANATALSRSRVAAFNAKSSESLTLIARGSATSADKGWNDLMKEAKAALPSGSSAQAAALDKYAAVHKTINDQDVSGNWDEAVEAAVSFKAGSANAAFADYAQQSDRALTAQAASVSSGLEDAGKALMPTGILMVLAGLLAAVGAWWGISLRLDEYR
jgi:hypothetical protein